MSLVIESLVEQAPHHVPVDSTSLGETSHGAKQAAQWSPYEDNGGTTVALCGKDYCIVAADTRQSTGYNINARWAPKAYQITEKAVLATSGFHADGSNLVKLLKQRIEWYQHKHEKTISTPAIAQMLSTILYGKRFFPYYTFNLLGGVDEQGKGCVFSFDPVGSYEREFARAGGSASSLIQPFLDNQIMQKNHDGGQVQMLSIEDALKIVKDAFTSATERDIYTGDYLQIWITTKEGTKSEVYPLKKD